LIKIGLEKLIENSGDLQGKRIGLITNPTGINRSFKSTIDVIADLDNVHLTALYSVEHGVRGDGQAGEKIETYIDPKTNVPVYSLYGETERPTYEMLKDIDILVYDIQDVGVRFYTYISTLAYTMEAAKQYDIAYIVLDRPNPITGKVEGSVLQEGFSSFVGVYPVAARYGLTVGELAQYYNGHFKIGCRLQVFQMQGWTRDTWFDQTGLPWVAPSPNLPTIESVILYPGTCFLEGTNISEGRGTTKPFELFGAPWMDGEVIAEALNSQSISGVAFRPTYFKPTFSKHAGELVNGVQIHITNRNKLASVELGIRIIQTIQQHYPDQFEWRTDGNKFTIDRLDGSERLRKAIDGGNIADGLLSWKDEADKFRESTIPYLLYS
jgi:uncharacterized protein YbbC (DUF1343 family)